MPQKQKTKFVSINAKNCSNPLLPGREKCDCQAVKHELVNNCLSCGRVVCLQEGAGPCFFCGEIVLNKADRSKLQTGSAHDVKVLMNKYKKLPNPQAETQKRILEAQAQKEKLLEFDKNSVQRTRVIDDQSDYFAAESPWLSEEERKKLKEKKQAYLEAKNRLKRKVKITIDFAGRRVIQEDALPDIDLHSLSLTEDKSMSPKATNSKSISVNKPFIEPKFLGNLERETTSVPILWSHRLQDSQLQEMSDSGNCLSVNQPYASMIIEGIKLFEGRIWYTPVRGRLWIHAGKKVPTPELLEEVKACYRNIVGEIEFPETFPTGCLLGCVDLVDCIPQEEYLNLYPNGEVSDPYVFVMADPKVLSVKLPMNGKPKIFKLDQHIHQAAKRSLEN